MVELLAEASVEIDADDPLRAINALLNILQVAILVALLKWVRDHDGGPRH